MSKIAIIVGSFHPNSSPNGICAKKIAEEFLVQKNEVIVISRKQYAGGNYTLHDGIENYNYKSSYSRRITDFLDVGKKNIFIIVTQFILSVLLKIITLISSPFYPNISSTLVNNIYDTFDKLMKSRNFDMVICIYSPIENMIVASKIKENYKVPVVLYALDSINDGYTPKFSSKTKVSKKIFDIETKIFEKLDLIIMMHSHRRTYETERYSPFTRKITYLDIPLFSKNKIMEKLELDPKVNMAYIGSLQKRIKEPYRMLDILSLKASKDIVFHFIGSLNNVKIDVGKYDNINIVIHNKLSHTKALQFMQSVDILINIGSLNLNQIPSKIFEYISTGKPIISFYDNDNEPSLTYLKKYPNSLLIDERNNNEKNYQLIRDFIIEMLEKPDITFNELEKDFQDNTAQKFVDVTTKLMEK